MTGLEELSFEASSEFEAYQGPKWDWLFGSSMEAIIEIVPQGPKCLTLDTAGSTMVTSKDDRTPMKICSLIARRPHDFQYAGLKMRHICPRLLDMAGISPVAYPVFR